MIKDYKELDVWQKSIELVIEIYDILTVIPLPEKYALVEQIRRSSISVPSKIAEGYERQTKKEFIQFLYIALGLLSDVETQLILINRLYKIDVNQILDKITSLRKMLDKLTSALKRRTS